MKKGTDKIIPAQWTAVYARQSADRKDSISIETQVAECRKLTAADEPVRVYYDKGYSGKNTERPSFQRMIQDIQNGNIKKVIVYKLDRCTRSVLDFYRLLEFFKKNDCDFISARERNMDTTTPTGRAMIGMIAIFAELERETIQQRIADNYYSRIEKDGRWPGGPAPLGYQIQKGSHPPRLEYNKEEMEAVKIIYDRYYNDNNISLLQIARFLEEAGLKGRKGRNFRATVVLNVLRNPIYIKADKSLYCYFQSIGIRPVNPMEEWNGEKSAHIICSKQGKKYTRENRKDCIVYLTSIHGLFDSNMYISIQKRLANNKQLARGNQPSRLEWLAGLLKCAKCGYSIRIYSRQYLSCFGKCVMHECDASFSVKNVTFEQVRNHVSQSIQKYISQLGEGSQGQQPEQKDIDRGDSRESFDVSRYQGMIFAQLPDEAKKRVANELIDRILLEESGNMEIVWRNNA